MRRSVFGLVQVGSGEVAGRTRLALGVASLLAGVVVAFTGVPVRVLPAGSPGTDPGAGALVFESLSAFLHLPTLLMLLVWVVLGAAVWYGGPLLAGRVLGWVLPVLALVLGLACFMFAGWGYWVSLTGFAAPAMGTGAYLWWLLSSAALTAVAVGVLLLPRLTPSASLRMVAALATSLVPSVAALLVVGHRVQSEPGSESVGLSFAAGAASVVLAVALVGPVYRTWRDEATHGGSTSVRWLNRAVLIIGTVVAMFWLVRLVHFALFVGGGVSPALVPFGPVLFAVVSYLPVAASRDLALSRTGQPQLLPVARVADGRPTS